MPKFCGLQSVRDLILSGCGSSCSSLIHTGVCHRNGKVCDSSENQLMQCMVLEAFYQSRTVFVCLKKMADRILGEGVCVSWAFLG